MNENSLRKPALRQQLEASHTPEQVAARLKQKYAHSHVKDFVYGAIDGTVTTFAVVSGVAGAELSSRIVIIMGIANLLADGFSMAVSNYLGTRTETQLLEKTRQEELNQVNTFPDGEKEEIRQIYAQKGFTGDQLEDAVRTITGNQEQWVNTMLQEEFDLPLQGGVAWKAALSTFVAFLLVGSLPVFPFLWNWLTRYPFGNPFLWSTIFTGIAFFGVGAAKSRFVNHAWYKSGLETLLLGGGAAALSYGVGLLLKEVVV